MNIRGKRTARLARPFRAKVIGSAIAISAASLAVLPLAASATVTGPYTSAAIGYDVSWPNCTDTPPTSPTVTFAIVGITDGRPFTSSPCAWNEYSTAQNLGEPSLYFNTGYAGAYARDIVSTCSKAVTSLGSSTNPFGGLKGHKLTQAEQAWEIGCSEAQYGVKNEPGTALFWWADVETGNSWSTNVSLNQFTIDGMSYAMNNFGNPGGGVYSLPSSWTKLTGSRTWIPTPAVPTWVAGGSCTASSSSTWFASSSTYPTPYLVQNTSFNGLDGDTAC
ncbi:MAG: hypothetical protein M0Z29_05285 [Actinomycetota bacterium]|nr:hypothetical protein [Actinomycetota bacterium]